MVNRLWFPANNAFNRLLQLAERWVNKQLVLMDEVSAPANHTQAGTKKRR
jgi:hypothetical protein